MKFLLLIVAALALTLAQDAFSSFDATADAVVRGDRREARRTAVEGLRAIRTQLQQLRRDNRDCRSSANSRQCRRDVRSRRRPLRRLRRSFRRLEWCLARFRYNGSRRVRCVTRIRNAAGRTSAATTTAATTTTAAATTTTAAAAATTTAAGATTAPASGVKAAVLTAVDAAVAGSAAADPAGDAAIAALRQRIASLRQQRDGCRNLSGLINRSRCRRAARRGLRRVRREALYLARIERCLNRFPSDASRRQTCIAPQREALLSFLIPGRIPTSCHVRDFRCLAVQRRARRARRATTVANTSVPTTPTKLPAAVVQAVRTAVSAANTGANATNAGEAAIAALRARVEAVNRQVQACRALSRRKRRTCLRNMRNELRRNRRERRLVKRLERCARRFRDNEARRTNCVARVVRVLMQMVNPLSPSQAPASIPALENQERSARTTLRRRIRSLRGDLRRCSSRDCRDRVKNAILVARVELQTIDARFAPRRICMMQRRRIRNVEMRTRALEHLRLYRIHRRAARCTTRKCAKRLEKRQHQMERHMSARRAERLAAWNKLRCPVVLPTTTPISTTLTSAAPTTVASTTVAAATTKPKARPGSGLNARRAELHLRLNRLYLEVDNCADNNCKARIRSQITSIKAELRALSRERRRWLRQDRRRHLRRARLHRRLNVLYNRAANCASRSCRIRTRALLRKYKRALKALDRSLLGAKRHHGLSNNRYARQLRALLSECPRREAGKKCRTDVFNRFRQQTEERDRALLDHLRGKVHKKVTRDIRNCAVSATSRANCIRDVQKWESSRIGQLLTRVITLEKDRALRMCEGTADVNSCRDAVNAEFKKDLTRASAQAATAAAKDVVKIAAVEAPGVKVTGRAGSASTLAVTGSLILAVIAVIAMF